MRNPTHSVEFCPAWSSDTIGGGQGTAFMSLKGGAGLTGLKTADPAARRRPRAPPPGTFEIHFGPVTLRSRVERRHQDPGQEKK